MKIISVFLSENFQVLEVKFSIFLNRRVFVMIIPEKKFNTEYATTAYSTRVCYWI